MPEAPENLADEQPSTALTAPTAPNPLARAREVYDEEERQAIAKFLNVGAEDTALVPFLAIAAQLGLSPIHGEIWLIKGRRKEGSQYVDFYRPAIGRDGLLKHARANPRFKGIRFGVVCANDTFEVEDDGWETKVLHRMASLSPATAGDHESRWRGKVLGAWAKLFFNDGSPPLYYFAPAHEHVKVEDKVKDGETIKQFAGAWSYTSTMIVKSAVSYVLRLGFGVTGVVPFDELRVDDPQMMGGAAGEADTFDSEAPALDEDPNPKNAEFIGELELPDELRDSLTIALEQVNELAPFSWTPAKVRMRLGSDCDEAKGREVLAEVEAEFTALRKNQAEREAREAEAAKVEEAVQVVMARDVKPPAELHDDLTEASKGDWIVVEDVIYDGEAERMVFKLADGGELSFSPTDEVEIRTPEGADEEG